MKILQNRKFAVAVFVVVVIVWTLLGSHHSLSRLSAQMEEAFFNKDVLSAKRENLEGYTSLGDHGLLAEGYYSCPSANLEDCVNYSNRILSLIKDDVSNETYNEIYESRRSLIAALESRDISDIYDAHALLYKHIMHLEENTVTNNYDDFVSVRTDFQNASNSVEKSGYNQCVDLFMITEMNRFPANILRHLTSVDMPEKYE